MKEAAVENQKRQGNWKGKPKDLKKEQRILDYYKEHPDVPYRGIAEAVGVAEVTAYKTLKAHGLINSREQAQKNRRVRHERLVLTYRENNPTASLKEIADFVGLTPATVRKMLANNNASVPKKTPAHRDETNRLAEKRRMIEEYSENHPQATAEEVMAALGTSSTYTYTVLKEMNLPYTKKKRKNEEIVLSYAKENPTATPMEIAKAVGLSMTTVRKTLVDNNMQIVKGKKKKEREQKILQYKSQHPHCSQKEIAEAVGVSMTTVHSVLSAHGLNFSTLKKKEYESYLHVSGL